MPDKVHCYEYDKEAHGNVHAYTQYWFHCPGCKHSHAFTVGDGDGPRWSFNGDLANPTFEPSLLCNRDYPATRCHCFVRNGQIQFLDDCFHELKGMTIDLPDWE